MSLTVTPLYAALIAALFVALSVRTIQYRRSKRINLGTADDAEMLRRMRIHANCAEYAPFGLLLLTVIELQGAPGALLHLIGLALLVGRVIHAWALSSTPQVMPGRVAGMILTFSAYILAILTALALWAF